MAAVTFGIAAVPLALFASLTTASASGTNVTIVISKPSDAARQLESAFAAHHFKIAVAERRFQRTSSGRSFRSVQWALQVTTPAQSARSLVNATAAGLAVT